MKVTECRSGKKYFEKADKLKRANVLETIKTNKESVVFRYYASLVRPEKSKRHAHQFMVMDNAQSYQTHVAAVYRTVDGKKRLALTHPGQLKSGLSCVSFKVFEEI